MNNRDPDIYKWVPAGYVLLFLLLAAGIGVVGYFYLKSQIIGAKTAAEKEISSISKLKTEQISHWYQEHLDHARFFTNLKWLASNLIKLEAENPDSSDKNEMMQFVDAIRDQLSHSRTLIFNSKGKLLFSSPRDEFWLGDLAQGNLEKVLVSHEMIVTDLHVSKVKKDFINMDIFVPICVEEGGKKRLAGIVMMEIDPSEFLYPLIQTWPTPSATAETLLVARDGDYVVFINELRHMKDTALKLRLPIDHKSKLPAAMAIKGKEGIVEGLDYRNVPVIADIRKVPNTCWHIVSKVDKDEIYDPIRKQAVITLALIIVLIFSTALGVNLLWKKRDNELLKESRDELEMKVKERTAALENSLQEIRDLYNNAPCGYHSLDKDGRFVMVNDTELGWLGYSREELIGRKVEDIFTEKSRKIFQREFPRFKEKGAVNDIDFEMIRKDGSIIPIILNATAIKDSEGAYLMSRSTVIDITERRNTEKELEKLNRNLKQRTIELETVNKELEAFSYSVSHDLKAPLRSVDGFAKMLEEDYAGKLDDEGKRLLNVIRESAKDMGQLISDLLEFSRMSRREIHKTEIDMEDLIREIYSQLTGGLDKRIIKIEIDSLPKTFGDTAMIREVVSNLLSNAIKFTGTRKEAMIKVKGGIGEGEVIYSFKDNGVGFNMEYKEKLFCVFQRLHTVTEFEGTGIGLALVQRIVQRHGGRVWAEGKLGEGAEFSFSLPIIEKK